MTEADRRKAAVELALSGQYKKFEFYEGSFTDNFVRAVPGKVVVDCGMCYGYYTALAIWAGAQMIHGFEPDDERHGLHLRESFGDRQDVTVHFSALGCHTGRVALLKRPGTLRSLSATKEIALARGNPKMKKLVPVRLPCTTIDDAVQGRVDVIKCDTEGGEATIFHGAVRTLQEYKPVIFLELHRIPAAKMAALVSLLGKSGYDVNFKGPGRYILEVKS
jgi:FkbM family methyltransferase